MGNKEPLVPPDPLILVKLAVENYPYDVPDAKYKKGQNIRFTHRGNEHSGTIVAVNDTGEGMEYWIADYPWAIWEKEVLGLNECTSCGQRLTDYQCTHCGAPQ